MKCLQTFRAPLGHGFLVVTSYDTRTDEYHGYVFSPVAPDPTPRFHANYVEALRHFSPCAETDLPPGALATIIEHHHTAATTPVPRPNRRRQ